MGLMDRLFLAARAFARTPLASGGMQTREGRLADDAPPDAPASMVPLLYWERWANLTHSLTPARLRSILQAADDGDILAQHQLFSDMEDRCDHLAADMAKRKRALLTLDWEILPGRARDKAARNVADAVREQFDALASVDDLFLDMADGVGHGFAALEIEWGREGKVHLPQAFHFRPQTFFQVSPQDRNALRLRDGTAEGAGLQPLGWVLHVHRSRSGWLPRAGLFRVLAWAYLIRAYALAANSAYVEVHGMPFRLGKYPAASTEEDKAALRKALQALGRDAAGIIPQGMEIVFQTPTNSTHDHFGLLIDRCERGMSKAILGGTLTSQADGKSSTNALGAVHNEIRHDLLTSDALQIAGTLTQQVLAPLAVLNVGVSDPRLLPWFRFDTRQAADLATYADALPKLSRVMRIPAAWAHEKLKIPQPQDEEEDLLGSRAQPGMGHDQGPDARDGVAGLASLAEDRPGPASPYPDQDAVDRAAIPDASLHNAMERLLAPLVAELRGGMDPADLLVRLGDLYPRLDSRDLEELLARAIFVGEVWGRVSADNGDA